MADSYYEGVRESDTQVNERSSSFMDEAESENCEGWKLPSFKNVRKIKSLEKRIELSFLPVFYLLYL